MQVYQQGAILTETTEEKGAVIQNDICIPHSSYEDESIKDDSSCEEETLLDAAINEQIIKLAVEVATKTVLEQLKLSKKKEMQERKDERIHNTKLLLENYRSFCVHAKTSIYEASQIDEDAIDILDLMWDPYYASEVKIASIKNSAMRTAIIMQHINEMIEVFRTMAINSGKEEVERSYRVFFDYYINEVSYSVIEISEKENIAERTVYRDLELACSKMASLIFGVDWIEK